MKQPPESVALIAVCVAVAVGILIALRVSYLNCADRDGRLVRGVIWYECVEAR